MMELSREVMMGKISMEEEVWKKVSPAAKDLISKMLVTRPEKRITPQVRSRLVLYPAGNQQQYTA